MRNPQDLPESTKATIRCAMARLVDVLAAAERHRLVLLSTAEHADALVSGSGLSLETAIRELAGVEPDEAERLIGQLQKWTESQTTANK